MPHTKPLCLSVKTVANSNTLIKAKLKVKTSTELTRTAYHYGILSQDTGIGDQDG